jgi:hypothetical protein
VRARLAVIEAHDRGQDSDEFTLVANSSTTRPAYRGGMLLDRGRLLGWRLARQALDPASGTDVVDVVRRVVALRGWPADLADLAVTVRQAQPEPGALGRALDEGILIRSYAFRGGSYVFTHEIGAVLLAVRTATRVWETRRYQQQGNFALDDWEPLREAVREALASGPKTRGEIGAHLAQIPNLRHPAVGAAGAGSDSLYKPLHWWGDICFGPARDGQTTFRLLHGDPHWPGLPDVDEAGRRAVPLYLGTYGPATVDNLVYWFTEGLGVPRRRLFGWLADLGDEVAEVSTDTGKAYALAADLDELRSAEPSDAVRLLPGFDPWVMGPGTADPLIIAPERRALATRGSNLVIWRGVVCGTWRIRGTDVMVSWFSEADVAPTSAIDRELRRLESIQGRELRLTLDLV